MDGIGDADARRATEGDASARARPASGPAQAGDRRHEGERRDGGTSGGRRGATAATSPLVRVLRSLGAIVVLLGVILYTVSTMKPVYAGKGTVGEELRKLAPASSANDTALAKFVQSPQFKQEKQNFYEDVMRLKQVDSARADSIAQYAVREAYVRGISPAIIFGVMLTENSKFISKAMSNVGAVGLMQVYPKVWLNKELGARLGKDLATDSTNVKYGVFILSHYFNPKTKTGETKERDWATALLRYNGCVRGTNTPRCHTYPNKVQGFVEKQATSICNGRGFYDCIAKPVIQGLFGDKLAPNATEAPATATITAPAGTPPVAAPATVTPAASPAPTATATAVVAAPAGAPAGSSPKAAATPAVPKAAPAPATPTSAAKRSHKAAPSHSAAKKATPARRSASTAPHHAPVAKKKSTARQRVKAESVPNAPKPITVKIP